MLTKEVERVLRDPTEVVIYRPEGLPGNRSHIFRCLLCPVSMRLERRVVDHVRSLKHTQKKRLTSEADLKMLRDRKFDIMTIHRPTAVARVVSSPQRSAQQASGAGPSGIRARAAAYLSGSGNRPGRYERVPQNSGLNGQTDRRTGMSSSPQVAVPHGNETHPRLLLARTDSRSWAVRSADSTPRMEAHSSRPSVVGPTVPAQGRDRSQPISRMVRHPPIPDVSIERCSMIRATLSFQCTTAPSVAPSEPEPLSEEYKDEARSKDLYDHAVEVVNAMGSLVRLCNMTDCQGTLGILKKWTSQMAGIRTKEKREWAAFKFDMLRLLNDLMQAAVAWVADHRENRWNCARAMDTCAKVDFFLQCAQEKSEEANTKKPAVVEVIDVESDDDTPSTSGRCHSSGTPGPFPKPESTSPSQSKLDPKRNRRT